MSGAAGAGAGDGVAGAAVAAHALAGAVAAEEPGSAGQAALLPVPA